MNLLNETIEILKENNKTEQDVLWCGLSGFYFLWEDFRKMADFEYDNGWGGVAIHLGLIIVGENFWLEREEYDGSEWWAFKSPIEKPEKYHPPETLQWQ